MTTPEVEMILLEADEKMRKAAEVTHDDLGGLRSGRASPALVQKIQVEYYGTPTPLRDLATINAPEARLLVIQPYDKSSMASIEKAIQSSDLGITPSNDGNVIRLPFPPLTEDRRKDLIRVAHKRAEEGRVAVRNVRRHAKDQLEKMARDGEISEDELHRSEKQLQQETDQHIKEIDELLAHKEAELKEV